MAELRQGKMGCKEAQLKGSGLFIPPSVFSRECKQQGRSEFCLSGQGFVLVYLWKAKGISSDAGCIPPCARLHFWNHHSLSLSLALEKLRLRPHPSGLGGPTSHCHIWTQEGCLGAPVHPDQTCLQWQELSRVSGRESPSSPSPAPWLSVNRHGLLHHHPGGTGG